MLFGDVVGPCCSCGTLPRCITKFLHKCMSPVLDRITSPAIIHSWYWYCPQVPSYAAIVDPGAAAAWHPHCPYALGDFFSSHHPGSPPAATACRPCPRLASSNRIIGPERGHQESKGRLRSNRTALAKYNACSTCARICSAAITMWQAKELKEGTGGVQLVRSIHMAAALIGCPHKHGSAADCLAVFLETI